MEICIIEKNNIKKAIEKNAYRSNNIILTFDFVSNSKTTMINIKQKSSFPILPICEMISMNLIEFIITNDKKMKSDTLSNTFFDLYIKKEIYIFWLYRIF